MGGGRAGFGATFRRALLWTLAAILALALAWLMWIAGHLAWWRTHPPRETAFMNQRMQALEAADRRATLHYRWVPYARISDHLKRAMIAAEDAHFVEHEGFDWEGIQLAREKNQRRGRVVAGGSTITQQLAKNLFLSPVKSYWRKGEEAVITVLLENMLDKTRIFELYLNVIEWGNGVFGAEAAAERYFGISARELNAEQAARLAAMAPNPRFYERHQNAPGLSRKIRIILARMPGTAFP